MKHPKIFKTVKQLLFVDLMIGIVITIVTWKTLGTEGLAAEFCNLTDVEMCDEVEWTEDR
jgi:hypothetical protein